MLSTLCASVARSAALASGEARTASTVSLSVPAGVPLLLLASAPGDEIARWARRVEPLTPGAATAQEVWFPAEPPRFQGIVVDRASSRPIAGATLQARDGGGPLPCLSAVSAADGRFTLATLPEGFRAPVAVRAAGYGHVDLFLSEARLDAESPVVVQLEAASTLALSVRRGDGSPVPGLGIGVTALVSGPGVAPAPERSAQTDASGSCAIPDLPARAVLKLKLYRNGRVLREEPDVPPLAAGERRELTVQLGDGVKIRGRLVDQHGAPIPAAPVRIRSAALRTTWFASDPFTAERTTDRDGRFAFEDIPPGSWQIGAVALQDQPSAVAPVPQLLRIAAGERELEVTLVAHRGLSISGEVVDGGGRPVPGVLVVAHGAGEFQTVTRARTDARGRFVLAPLGPTEYRVASSGPSSTPVRARGGDAGVVLRLAAQARVRGVVVDARTGLPVSARVTIARVDGPSYTVVVPTRGDGVFQSADLQPGRWRVQADTRTQRGHLPDLLLQAGESVEELQVRVEEGAVLGLSSALPGAQLSVVDAQGRSLCPAATADATWRCVVEPGRVLVRELDAFGSVTRELEITLRAGERRAIDLRAQR